MMSLYKKIKSVYQYFLLFTINNGAKNTIP